VTAKKGENVTKLGWLIPSALVASDIASWSRTPDILVTQHSMTCRYKNEFLHQTSHSPNLTSATGNASCNAPRTMSGERELLPVHWNRINGFTRSRESFSIHPSESFLALPKMGSVLSNLEMIGNNFVAALHWREHWFYSCLPLSEQVFAVACTERLLTSYIL